MSGLHRQALVVPGPVFFAQDGQVFFKYIIDGSSEIGPAEATDQDKAQHATAWAEFMETVSRDAPAQPQDSPSPQKRRTRDGT